jgi:hypothetical protein
MRNVWELPQWLLARALILITRPRLAIVYNNCRVWRHNRMWGVSLGKDIIIGEHHGFTAIKHEYGHTRQSRILGPLYLIVVGIPSVSMNILTRIGVLRADRYYDRWPENWADKLGGVER